MYLKSSICHKLLNENVENLFSEAFFVIDVDKKNWDKRLTALLNNPIQNLISEWKLKQKKREILKKEYLIGPAGNSGLRAANYIDLYLKSE